MVPTTNDRIRMPTSPNPTTSAKTGAKPTTKQQREAKRAEKVAALQAKLARERRNRTIAIASSITGGALVIALVVTLVFVNSGRVALSGPNPVAAPVTEIDGVEMFEGLTAVHVTDTVDYEAEYGMLPPAGGDHAAAWLTCGVYDQPQPNENAVHALEHGAVWVTYDPDAVDDATLSNLLTKLPKTYVVVSPFPGLPSPIVASAWGAQLQLESPDDSRLGAFLSMYWKSPAAPEPGAACSGAFTGPGKVA